VRPRRGLPIRDALELGVSLAHRAAHPPTRGLNNPKTHGYRPADTHQSSPSHADRNCHGGQDDANRRPTRPVSQKKRATSPGGHTTISAWSWQTSEVPSMEATPPTAPPPARGEPAIKVPAPPPPAWLSGLSRRLSRDRPPRAPLRALPYPILR